MHTNFFDTIFILQWSVVKIQTRGQHSNEFEKYFCLLTKFSSNTDVADRVRQVPSIQVSEMYLRVVVVCCRVRRGTGSRADVRRSLTLRKRAPSQVSLSNYPRFTWTICSDLRRNCTGDLRPVSSSGTGVRRRDARTEREREKESAKRIAGKKRPKGFGHLSPALLPSGHRGNEKGRNIILLDRLIAD